MKRTLIHIKRPIAGTVMALLLFFAASAQDGPPQLPDRLAAVAMPNSNANWIEFREGTSVDPKKFFTHFKSDLKLGSRDSMRLVKTTTDELKFNHFRYEQFYKDRRVVYGEYLVHQQANGFLRSANGKLITGLANLPSQPSINEEQALANATTFMGAKKYLWQNAVLEEALKKEKNNPGATYFPKGELVYAPADKSNDAASYKLAWHFKVYTDDPNVIAKSVYVDATTGKVINSVPIAMQCSTGSGTSAYNGTVSLSTFGAYPTYYSWNSCQATDIKTFNCNGGGPTNSYYVDTDNTWTNQSAVQAQFGGRMTYNYFNGQHSRQSWDGAAGDMILYNNAYAGSNNACWGCTGNSTIYYAGSTSAATDDWNTLDIVGHEFTHGVTQASANLVYEYESGALNESFSDIFGEMVESWSVGSNDYLIGADRGAIRSMINPNLYGDPDTYLGTNWYSGTGDNGGVHINSGVQNRWFHLLSEGGSGTNDKGQAYSVTGITRFKARLIAYRALTQYLTSTSKYIDARKASLQAAWDLYGQCSPEIIAVGDAWHAVGVESQSPAYVINACGTYPSAGTWIQAISLVTGGNGCTTTITSGAPVTFTARDRVVLYPGFKATFGSTFVAYIEPCSSTRWATNKLDVETDRFIVKSDPENGMTTQSMSMARPNDKAPTEVSEKDAVGVTPNPFHTTFDVTIQSDRNTTAKIILYNAIGNTLEERQKVGINKGLNRISFAGSKLPVGVYYVDITMDGKRSVKSVTKL